MPKMDPFLLLDYFGADNPEDYLAGFPWHPHRGIETVTYVLDGTVDHGDSLANSGTIGPGDVQWMTAGSGIIHEEMPKPLRGKNRGFQLWVNLPASHKMTNPTYRGFTAQEIPEVVRNDGARIRIICGDYDGTAGPVEGLVVDAQYLDISLPKGKTFDRAIPQSHNVFVFVFEGAGAFGPAPGATVSAVQVALFGEGDDIHAHAKDGPARFLLISGERIQEPVAWRGPIVMNTAEELETAFTEYTQGTFIKK
jgi:redox-sensitive bicupin YhaK (pirin superfamily)